MARRVFSEINAKAAAITGAVLGFVCGLLAIPYGLSGYGVTGYMMGYQASASDAYVMGSTAYAYGLLFILLDIVLGAVLGAVIALIYNWALKL